jgi:hypothetical protein
MLRGRQLAVVISLALCACAAPVPLEDRRCPCVEPAYRCCLATGTCVARALACPVADPGMVQEPAPPAGAAAPDAAAPDTAIALDAPAPGSDAAVPDAPALDPPTPDAPAADAAPPDIGPTLSAPRWVALGETGLSGHRVIDFDLRVAEDGTPVLVLSQLPPGGRPRVSSVLRYDGTDWQILGEDLPAGDVLPGLALSRDGTPHLAVGGALLVLVAGNWQTLPLPPAPMFIPPAAPMGLARDDQGRFYLFAGRMETGFAFPVGVTRFDGGSWELLGPVDTFGRAPSPSTRILAADRQGPYVCVSDVDEVFVDVRRWDGRAWVAVGGGTFEAQAGGTFLVAPDGQAYYALGGGLPIKTGSPRAPWRDLPVVTSAREVVDLPPLPALAVGPDGVLHAAYLADRDPGPAIVPGPAVFRLEGDRFLELPLTGLPPGTFDSIELQIGRSAGRDVLYLAYLRDLQLVVTRLQR